MKHGSHYSLDWTTGLTQNGVKCPIQPFQCRIEANLVNSAHFFATFAPLACWIKFTGVSRGQRSHAYLISFNNEIQPVTDDVKLFSMLQPIYVKVCFLFNITALLIFSLKLIKYACDFWPLLTPVKLTQQAKGANLAKRYSQFHYLCTSKPLKRCNRNLSKAS